jgi:16S rRNA G966 N2-methylase RsmD
VVFFDPPYAMVSGLKRGSPLFKSIARLTRDELTPQNALMILRTPTESQFDLPDAWVPFRVLTLGSMDMHLLRKEGTVDADATNDIDDLA